MILIAFIGKRRDDKKRSCGRSKKLPKPASKRLRNKLSRVRSRRKRKNEGSRLRNEKPRRRKPGWLHKEPRLRLPKSGSANCRCSLRIWETRILQTKRVRKKSPHKKRHQPQVRSSLVMSALLLQLHPSPRLQQQHKFRQFLSNPVRPLQQRHRLRAAQLTPKPRIPSSRRWDKPTMIAVFQPLHLPSPPRHPTPKSLQTPSTVSPNKKTPSRHHRRPSLPLNHPAPARAAAPTTPTTGPSRIPTQTLPTTTTMPQLAAPPNSSPPSSSAPWLRPVPSPPWTTTARKARLRARPRRLQLSREVRPLHRPCRLPVVRHHHRHLPCQAEVLLPRRRCRARMVGVVGVVGMHHRRRRRCRVRVRGRRIGGRCWEISRRGRR